MTRNRRLDVKRCVTRITDNACAIAWRSRAWSFNVPLPYRTHRWTLRDCGTARYSWRIHGCGFQWKPRLHAKFERLSFAAVCGGTVTYAGSTCTSPVCTVYCAINCIQNKYWCPFVRPVIIISDWSHSQKSTRSSGMFVFSLLVRPWRRGKRYVCPYQRPEVVWGE